MKQKRELLSLIEEHLYAIKTINKVLQHELTNTGCDQEHFNNNVLGGLALANNLVADDLMIKATVIKNALQQQL